MLLPHKQHPPGTTDRSMRNLEYPLDWDGIFDTSAFPAFLKPHDGGGWKNVYKVNSPEEFFAAYDETGDLCMTLQRGRQIPGIFPLLRRRPEEGARHALRSRRSRTISATFPAIRRRRRRSRAHGARCLTLCRALGYDLNTVEFAVRRRHPLRHRLHESRARRRPSNPSGPENFRWIVDAVAEMAVAARAATGCGVPYRWSAYLQSQGGKIAMVRERYDGATPERTRPSLSIGIEEEYQTIDPETRDLRSHIHAEIVQKGKTLLAERVKPEMHQSVVEIGTGVCKNIQEAREEIRDPSAARSSRWPAERAAPGGRRHASLRPLARTGDLPRRALPHHRRGHEDGGARQPDLRPARPHRRRGPRNRHPAHERRALFPAAHPGALHQLAVLAGHGYRPAVLSLQSLRQVSAHQHPGPLPQLVANSRTSSTC